MWRICPVTLKHGDCLELMKDIPDGSVDLILCDLPYAVTKCKWDVVIPYEPMWEQYNRIIKDNGAILLFAVQPFTTALINSNKKQYRYNWYWKKNNRTGGVGAKLRPMRCVEDICVFYKKQPTYNPQGLVKLRKPLVHKARKHVIYGHKVTDSIQTHKGYPHHLLEFDNAGYGAEKRTHPTQKPVALLEYLVKTYTNPRRYCS